MAVHILTKPESARSMPNDAEAPMMLVRNVLYKTISLMTESQEEKSNSPTIQSKIER